MKKNQDCIECDFEGNLRASKVVHKYKESGLDYITLVGVEEAKCPSCGAIYLHIPHQHTLRDLIASVLMRRSGVLTGGEVRFLRKQLGFSSEQFARLLKYDPKTLSRIENGHQKVSPPFDRMVRLAYATGKPELNYKLQDLMDEEGVRFARLRLSFENRKDWRWVKEQRRLRVS